MQALSAGAGKFFGAGFRAFGISTIKPGMVSSDDDMVESASSASETDEARKRARKEAAARKAAERDLRLKAQLRANLQRRRAQTRARRECAEDDRPGDLAMMPSEE